MAQAQRPKAPFEPTRANASRLRWLEYKMVAGRVVATSVYPEGMNISFGPSVIDGRLREHLQLLILKDRATVQYELDGDRQELAIALTQDGEFSIRRSREEPKFSMRFVQQPGRPLSLWVTEGDAQRQLQAESFWHLYIADPELVRRHLIPYLEILRPSWQLAATGWAIEEALVQRAQHPRPPDTDRWTRLVGDLASPKFATRQSAERELVKVGQIALPFLEALKRQNLDPEQAARVRDIVEALSVDYEDTTDRVATWLVNERPVWLSLLGRAEEVKRRVALTQLDLLLGRSLDFDPVAEPAKRQAQLEKLRAAFENSGPAGVITPQKPASVPPPGVQR